MLVTVRMFSTLTRYAPGTTSEFPCSLDEGATLASLLRKIRFPDQVERVVLVNGRYSPPETVLEEGDSVVLFPPMTGG